MLIRWGTANSLRHFTLPARSAHTDTGILRLPASDCRAKSLRRSTDHPSHSKTLGSRLAYQVREILLGNLSKVNVFVDAMKTEGV